MPSPCPMTEASRIVAFLGPTNTGKTHHAVERMLECESGMMGLPLRLLAREVFDRVASRVGRDRVALVTGEEKHIPRRPRYIIATVEAMPQGAGATGADVDFVAIDEVQLAAHRDRGHVFTRCLLHARGREETWLLGADTMRQMIRALVPTATHVEHPRLSSLRHTGQQKLNRLPPRSAIVAFSMDRVYELAERVRVARGGAAVVLGALSPRTRNAQVAMFQAGEVDTIVATDAIGMGLNLDIAHVAFAATTKFDGRESRPLEDAELAQIAGRAGRYLADGTFGSLAPQEIGGAQVAAVERHQFAPITALRYRPHVLDFSSTTALLDSLHVLPRRPGLQPAPKADDELAFEELAKEPIVRSRLRSEDDVRLLWDVASVPDFRKLLFEVHLATLRSIFLELMDRARVSNDFLESVTATLGSAPRDVEGLLSQITELRTWSYVANKQEWTAEPRRWQEETRALEDRLSDALHVALTNRFVSIKGARHSSSAGPKMASVATPEERPSRPGHPFAVLATFAVSGAIDAPRKVTHHPLEAFVDAAHDAFTLTPDGALRADGRAIAWLARGPKLSLPTVRMAELDDVGAGLRSRLERRSLAFARDVAGRLLAPLDGLATSTRAPLRGLAHVLTAGLGTARVRDVSHLLPEYDERDHELLREQGIVLGVLSAYAKALLDEPMLEVRRLLVLAAHPRPARASTARVAFRATRADRTLAHSLGFVVLSDWAVRADVAERIAATAASSAEVAAWVGCGAVEAERIVAAVDRSKQEVDEESDPE